MGKSEVIKQLCIENGWTLSVMYLSNMSIEQLTGIPQIDHNNGSVAKWSKPQILSFDNAEVTGNSGINVLLLDDIHLATK